jgi:preprotein translocase subunit YajC
MFSCRSAKLLYPQRAKNEVTMRLITGLFVGACIAVAAPALAEGPVTISVGAQVLDANGGAVGTVTALQGDNVVVKTDKHQAALPKTSFAVSDGKVYFGMTQAQLNAEIEKSTAAAEASVAAGATVRGAAGTEIGKIESVTDTDVVIVLPSGKKIQIGRTGARGNADGTVTVGLTAEQIDAAVKGSTTPAK